jgi:hypothetical protein
MKVVDARRIVRQLQIVTMSSRQQQHRVVQKLDAIVA